MCAPALRVTDRFFSSCLPRLHDVLGPIRTIPALLPARFSEVNGGKSWILLSGFSIQPGESAKVLLIIFVVAFLVANRELFTSAGKRMMGMTFPRLRDLAPLLLVTFVAVIVLVYEKNLGFSLLVFGTVLAMGVHRDRARDLAADRHCHVRGRRGHRIRTVPTRTSASAGLARPVRHVLHNRVPDFPGAVRAEHR